MKNIGLALILLSISGLANAKIIRVDFESAVDNMWIARPVGSGYEFENGVISSDLAGPTINLADTISGYFIYDTDAPETEYSTSLNDPTYASYWALKSFVLRVGIIHLSNPDDADYLAIYDNGLSSGIDSFYTSGSYGDATNFNIFTLALFAQLDVWSGLDMPEQLNLDDYYYKRISGAFLPNANDLHLNWEGDITYLQSTEIVESSEVPIPSTAPLLLVGISALLCSRRRKYY